MLKLKELREEKNLSQTEVAKGINTSQKNISRWENGTNEPTMGFLCSLAEYFNVTLDYLCGNTNEDFLTEYIKPLREDEKQIIALYNKLSENDRSKVYGFLYALIHKF